MKNAAKTMKKRTKCGCAAVPRNCKGALSTIRDVMSFFQTFEGLHLGNIV